MQQHQYICRLQKCYAFLVVGVLSLLMISSVQGDDYLKEAPSFLQPCKLHDSQNGQCVSHAFQNIFTNWKDGIPGLKTIGGLDPYHVKKIHMEQNAPNLNFKLDAKNVVLTGLSHAVIQKSITNPDYSFKFLLKVPKMLIKSDYRIKGTILLLHLDGSGPLQLELSDAEISFAFKSNLVSKSGQKFFDITNVKTDLRKISNFRINLGNLFGGNIELENSANALFNEAWPQLFEVMRPVISETIDAITLDRYQKIFKYIPCTYFFNDI